MKVLYDSQIFVEQRYGGISRYFCEIANRASNKNDVTIKICAPTNSNSYLEQISSKIKFEPNFSKVKNYHARRTLNIISEEYYNAIFSPDIIHETYYSTNCRGKAKSLRVLTVYDMIHERLPGFFALSDLTSRHKLIATARADHVICISKATQSDFLEISGYPVERTSVIHLGFKLQGVSTEAQATELPNSTPYILYVGQRSGYKNFAALAAAMAQSRILHDFQLVCFGGGGFTSDELNTLLRSGLGGSRAMQIQGSDALLAKFYRGAACFVYPSLYEGFGIPPLEAMACDCPVACSNTSSIPEVVGDAGLYFDPTSTDDIRIAIEKIVSSPSVTEQLIARGRNRLKMFSWDRCASETFALYHRIHKEAH